MGSDRIQHYRSVSRIVSQIPIGFRRMFGSHKIRSDSLSDLFTWEYVVRDQAQNLSEYLEGVGVRVRVSKEANRYRVSTLLKGLIRQLNYMLILF
jgi:hypothetical protein